MKKKTVLLGITGSIAAYKACDAIRALTKKGAEVLCVMTKEAREFLTPLTLQTLSGNKVYEHMFEIPEKREIRHISLADTADLILICPATANIIAKIAQGMCDDLLTCTVLSAKCPVLLAPAMNERMYNNKITRDNITRLKKFGFHFVGPTSGRLACGSKGLGHLADLGSIIRATTGLLK